MPNAFYRQGLSGGGTSDLDYVDGASLAQDDVGFVIVDDVYYFYILDASNSAAENSPHVIVPDTNPGTKR